MSFIQNDEQLIARGLMKPFFRFFPDSCLSFSHEHILKHRVVRNQYIRWTIHHLKPGYKFSIIWIWFMYIIFKILNESFNPIIAISGRVFVYSLQILNSDFLFSLCIFICILVNQITIPICLCKSFALVRFSFTGI